MLKKIVLGLLLLTALILAACGGGTPEDTAAEAPAAEVVQEEVPEVAALPAGDAAAGEQLYSQSCSSCHGPDAKGIEGIGKDLTTGEFVPNHSDEEFLEFVKLGRPTGDPDNTTGIDMPPKGGNPALSDEQILDIIAYIRTIHE